MAVGTKIVKNKHAIPKTEKRNIPTVKEEISVPSHLTHNIKQK